MYFLLYKNWNILSFYFYFDLCNIPFFFFSPTPLHFIFKLPKNSEEESLISYFQEFGEIVELTIIRDKVTGSHKGCAFLTYKQKESALNAIGTLNDKIVYPIGGVDRLQLRPADNFEKDYKLFVGMLPKHADEIFLNKIFSVYGDIKEIHLIRNINGVSKMSAFVKYYNRESAIIAIQNLHGSLLEVVDILYNQFILFHIYTKSYYII